MSKEQGNADDASPLDVKLVGIETKISFLERANQELNDQVFQQQKEIEELNRLLANLAEKLRLAIGGVQVDDADDHVPPHY